MEEPIAIAVMLVSSEKLVRYRAFLFPKASDLEAALEALDRLSESQPVEYDVVSGSEVLVIPERLYPELKTLLTDELDAIELKTTPLSALPPEEQARRRGLMGHRRSA